MNEPHEYASIGRRAVAALIDAPIALIMCSCFLDLATGPSRAAVSHVADPVAEAAILRLVGLVGAFAVLMLYYALGESSGWRATLGKYFLDIEVVGLEGEQIGFRRAAWRFVTKYLGAIPAGIGFFRVFLSDKRQAFHDSCAQTIVVRGRRTKG